MSFTRTLVEDAIRDFALEAYPGIPWIFANQDGDIPPRPFGTILISDADAIGTGDIDLTLQGIQQQQRVREVFEVSVSIQAFGSSSMDIVAALKTHAKRPSVVIGSINTVLLGYLSSSPTRDLSEAISAKREGRAQADFIFSARFDSDLLVDTIKKVEIHGAGSTQTVEVP